MSRTCAFHVRPAIAKTQHAAIRHCQSHECMRLLLSFAVVAMLVGVIVPAVSGTDGDEVIVVYNSRVPESKSVAEHYAERRNVPKDQVFGLELNTGLEFSRDEFQRTL